MKIAALLLICAAPLVYLVVRFVLASARNMVDADRMNRPVWERRRKR